MAFRTTRQLLHQIRDFHRQLGEYYEKLEERSKSATPAEREKVEALLEYMSRHEKNIAQCLADYEKGAAKPVLDTWFEFTPEISKCACFDGIDLSSDLSVDDVVRTALWFDECLTKWFKQMADLSVSRDVQALFADLAQMEEQDERKATRMALEAIEGE